MFFVESGMQRTAIGIECGSARQEMEGESKLRRTDRNARSDGRARLRGALQRDDGQMPSAANERHHERSACCGTGLGWSVSG